MGLMMGSLVSPTFLLLLYVHSPLAYIGHHITNMMLPVYTSIRISRMARWPGSIYTTSFSVLTYLWPSCLKSRHY